ncbi:MAG: hypothetical protein GC154_05500 [bacterium]|nr:hypothetical protein [bacterium]
MAAPNREQIVEYIKRLETKVKQYQVLLKKRDLQIHALKTKLVKLVKSPNGEATASREPDTAEAAPEEAKSASMVKQAIKKPAPKAPELEERSDTFVKKAAPGATERVKEAIRAKEENAEAKSPATSPDIDPDSDEDQETDFNALNDDDESPSEPSAPTVFTPSVNFEAGEFLSAVLEGEEEKDEMLGMLEKLPGCEPDQKRNVLNSMTGLYWRMIDKMGKRLAHENLPWEKRLFMRYGMLDDKLMADRMDVWEQLYLDKSRPEDSGVYYMDEWLEEISRGNLRYSEIDEMALDGRKPDPNARGATALGYEMINIPQMQRICVGARANQVTIMMQEYCSPSRDNPVVTRAWMKEAMEKILNCDHIMFNRKYKGEDTVVQPLFIVLPGYGQRSGCWEPWSPGKKGTTGPRLCICAFPPRNSMKTLLMGVADYRWEWAKADAMHYWLSEGLTGKWLALFNKKEQRKDLKQVFVDCYQLWVLYESRRIPKLEKRFREFLYQNCPFSDKVKQTLKGGGVFARMIELEDAKKKREEEEQKEIERMKAEREARKAKRKAGAG